MDYKLPYKVYGNNVYIYGYAVECDLLILKQDSKAIFEAPEIYRAEDVITIAYSARTAHPFRRNGAPFRFKLSKAQQVD